MKKNKFTTYLLYAVGEIFLVVIGILIAVSINNWNAARKSDRFIEELIDDFEVELETNIRSANNFILHGYELDSLLTYYDHINQPEEVLNLPDGLFSFQTFSQRYFNDNLNKLIENESMLPAKYEKLVADLKELNRRILSRREWEKREMDLSFTRYEEMVDQYDWLGQSDPVSIEKRIAVHNSQIFKNKLFSYYGIRLSENIWDATLLRTTSVDLLWSLQTIRQPHQSTNIASFFSKIGLRPMTTISCYDTKTDSIKNPVDFRRNFIFYNESEDTVAFKLLRVDGSTILEGEKAPKQFSKSEFDMRNNEYLLVSADDSCNTVYYHRDGDYILLR